MALVGGLNGFNMGLSINGSCNFRYTVGSRTGRSPLSQD